MTRCDFRTYFGHNSRLVTVVALTSAPATVSRSCFAPEVVR
jgi:hypothetical protein